MKLRISGYFINAGGKKPSHPIEHTNLTHFSCRFFYTYFIVKIVLLVIYPFLETVIFRNWIKFRYNILGAVP